MKNLKFAGIELGTTIRAYDFEGRDDYVEGVVVAEFTTREGARVYSLDVLKDSVEHTYVDADGIEHLWSRRSDAHAEWINTNVPQETTFDWDGRIVVVPSEIQEAA